MQNIQVASHPFGVTKHMGMPLGMSIEAMSESLFGAYDGVVAFLKCGPGAPQIWQVVPRHMWKYLKPKGNDCLKFEVVPSGGKSGQTFALIAAIVISVAAPYLAAAVLPGVAAAAAAGSVAAQFAIAATTAAIAIGGNLLVSKLFPPAGVASQTKSDQAAQAVSDVDSDQNILGTDLPPPAALGLSRMSPYDTMYPHQYLDGGREVVERVFEYSGPHNFTNLRMGKVSADNLPGLEVEIRDGTDGQQTLVTKVAKTTGVGQAFTKFLTRTDAEDLTDQATPSISEPAPIVVAPGYNERMEQITLRMSLEPFVDQASETSNIRLPVRITMTNKATDAVITLPEVHITGRTLSQKSKEVHIRWDGNFRTVSTSSDFNYTFYQEVPATSSVLSDGSTGVQWEADAHFASGSGITETANIYGTLDSINVQLDPDLHPKADYDISVTVGLPIKAANFNGGTYALSGSVESLFKAKSVSSGPWIIPASLDGISGGASFDWATMIVNSRPVQTPGNAHIAIRATNIAARGFTVEAQKYFPDWNGSIWTGSVLSKNPAVIYRGVLAEWLNFFEVDLSIIANAELVAWRTECADRGYEVSFITTGQSVDEVLNQIATAGFASKRFGWGYGIEYLRDRSAETPVMSFSHRDSRISVQHLTGDIPKGFRYTYRNQDKDWEEETGFFNHPFGATSIKANEAITYPSISKLSLVKRRMLYDMLVQVYQRRLWLVETGPAGFNRVKGDLVNVVSDLFTEYAHGFYVRQVVDSKTVIVDRAVPAFSGEDIADITAVEDIEEVETIGAVSTGLLMTPGGQEEYTLAEVSGSTIRFVEDIPASWTVGSNTYTRGEALVGARLAVAARQDLFNRCIVLDVKRQDKQRARLTCVDAADIIFSELQRLAP